MSAKQFADLTTGMEARSERKITAELIHQFSAVSGDLNPVHLDETYAASTVFGKPIAHGLLIGSFISALIANELPGPGSIYLKQDLNFKKPVYIGDIVTTVVRVAELKAEKSIVKLETSCENQHGEIVIQGEAIIKMM